MPAGRGNKTIHEGDFFLRKNVVAGFDGADYRAHRHHHVITTIASGTRTLLLLLGDLHFFTSTHAVSPVSFLFVFGIAFHLYFPLHCSTVIYKWFSFWRLFHIISVSDDTKDNDHVLFFDLLWEPSPCLLLNGERRGDAQKYREKQGHHKAGRESPRAKGRDPTPPKSS
jgi:hypothetical protein